MDEIDNWWKKMRDDRMRDGAADAEKGVYNPPYPFSYDPQDDDENFAYEEGFHKRRRELGDKFEWQ